MVEHIHDSLNTIGLRVVSARPAFVRQNVGHFSARPRTVNENGGPDHLISNSLTLAHDNTCSAQDLNMCFACKRLGLSEDDEDRTSEQDHDAEEEIEDPRPQLPRRQLTCRAPREETVVEHAPCHDNTPAFAAYSMLEGTQPADCMTTVLPTVYVCTTSRQM